MPPPNPSEPRPVVVLSANCCSNLVHFRGALLAGLEQAGYRVAVIAPLDSSAQQLRDRGMEIRPIAMARSGTSAPADLRLLLGYLRHLRALRPLAYLGFTIKPNVYGTIAAGLAGVPAVNNVTGLGTAFLSQGLLWRLSKRLYAFAFRRSFRVFFHNADDLALFVEQRIVTPEQGRVIPGSGVDLQRFRPVGSSAAKDAAAPTFLFIGRLLADKGVREFVEAARQLRASYPNARFQLLGELDTGNRTSVTQSELQAWVGEGLVEHLGRQDEVRPCIAEATAVVLPSYREGLSRALLEAAAMGKPLVGTNVPGVRDLVEEGVTGALCEPRDPASVRDAMARIADAPPAELQRLGRNARQKVERGYGEEVVVRAYLETLQEIADAAKKP